MEGYITTDFTVDTEEFSFYSDDTIPKVGKLFITHKGFTSSFVYLLVSETPPEYTAKVVEVVTPRYSFPKSTKIQIEPLSIDFYTVLSGATSEWQMIDIGFYAEHLILVGRDGTTALNISFDGYQTHAQIQPGWTYAFDNRLRRYLFYSGDTTSPPVEVYAWRNPAGWGTNK